MSVDETSASTGEPTGTVTFLFIDVEGSTALLRELRERYGDVLTDHSRIVRSACEATGGTVVDTQGDSFLVAFRRVEDAARAATSAQRALRSHQWPAGVDLRVRMGMHTGQAERRDGHYVGLAVHRAARIAATAHGGQIVLSQTAASLLEDDEIDLEGATLRDLGKQPLKDFDTPVRIYQLTAVDLPQEFPPLNVPVARRARVRRRRLVLAGAALGCLVVAAVAFLVLRGSSASVPPVTPNTLVRIDPNTSEVVAVTRVGSFPGPVAVSRGSVWVGNLGDRTLSRVDARTNEVVDTIGLPIEPWALAADGQGRIWFVGGSEGYHPFARRVNPATGKVDVSIPLSTSVGDLALGDGALWVTNPRLRIGDRDHPQTITRVDLASRRVTHRIAVGDQPYTAAADTEAVWTANYDDNSVSRIPYFAKEALEIPVGIAPVAIAARDGNVWVAHAEDRSVWSLEPDGRPKATLAELDSVPTSIALDLGRGVVWVTLDSGAVLRVDAATGVIQRRIDLGKGLSAQAAVVGEDAVWVTVHKPA